METEKITEEKTSEQKTESVKNKTFVHTVRDWREYLGESALIVFSVLLALMLTEFFNYLHDREVTKRTLQNIIAELEHNKNAITETKEYNLTVLANIDSALINKNLQKQLVSNDEFHLNAIAPQGILYRYLNDEAWTIAKDNNVISKVDVETVAMLTRVYEDQAKMMKVEDEAAKVIFDRASRDPEQVHTTLILIRDIYHGWAVDRTNGMLQQIDNTITKIKAF
jgi:hypothetical protein